MRRRPRRNRNRVFLRDLIQENHVQVDDFIFPMFLLEGSNKKKSIPTMPGIFRLSEDKMMAEIEACLQLGIKGFCIFPVVDSKYKDPRASISYHSDLFYLKTLRNLKINFPEAIIISDVAMDPYSTTGHDGLVIDGEIVNDETLEILGKMALAQADTGIDFIAPSDMMDGRVAYLRDILDQQGCKQTGIISYAAKYASSFYHPFRQALDSAPKMGDKKTYQLNPANRNEALLEGQLDFEEGADILLVKPAMTYLDIVSDLKQKFTIPIAAYQVSGEYAMIKAAHELNWLNGEELMTESLLCIKRAGADMIFTYFAKEMATLLA